MSITIADCLKLPALRGAEVVGGEAGLDTIVASVSVLEWAEVSALDPSLFLGNEIVITAFYSVRNDVAEQCLILRRLHEVGEVGIIVYYVGLVLPDIDRKLIDTANELKFPLICMPKNIYIHRYSDAICEIMEAILRDKINDTQFSADIIQRISRLPSKQISMTSVLRMLSDRLHCSLIVADKEFQTVGMATWPMAIDMNGQDVFDAYKSKPDIDAANPAPRITINGNEYSAQFHSVFDAETLLYVVAFLFLNDEAPNSALHESLEVIKLANSIWHFSAIRENASDLLNAIVADEELKIQRIVKQLSIDLSQYKTLWIVKNSDTRASDAGSALYAGKLLSELKRFCGEAGLRCIAAVFRHTVAVFLRPKGDEQEGKRYAFDCMKHIESKGFRAHLIYYRNIFSPNEIRAAWNEINEHYAHAVHIYPHNSVFSMHEIQLAALCNSVIEHGESFVQAALAPIQILSAANKAWGDELLSTLKSFLLDAQMNIDTTARMLFVHRNTVKYRLKKIEEMFGYSLRALPESYIVYNALALDRLLNAAD